VVVGEIEGAVPSMAAAVVLAACEDGKILLKIAEDAHGFSVG
jgi:hypothetical protein